MAAEQTSAKPPEKSPSESQAREARLAKALRENLRRRKAPGAQGDVPVGAQTDSGQDER